MDVMKVFSLIAIVFGGMTIVSGSTVLFTDGAIQKSAGNYVAFVVWFNLISGFAYIAAGIGLWAGKKWSATLSIMITLGIAGVLLAFGVHVLQGGLFEPRTVYALTFRMLLWLIISVLAYRTFRTRSSSHA
ncbi:hypothetical protein KKI24_21415 [bacterium]|nr:hypothetical protein [bacterium]